jgi:hypothetical protein
MQENTANTSGEKRIDISDHAVLRWLQRVDPREQSPRTAIREAWRAGERVAVAAGEGRRAGEAVLVRSGDTLTTVKRGEA